MHVSHTWCTHVSMCLCVYISWTWSSRRTTCEGSSRSWETMRTSNSPLPSSPTLPRESWWNPLRYSGEGFKREFWPIFLPHFSTPHSLVVTSLYTWTTREDSCRRTWPGFAPMSSLTWYRTTSRYIYHVCSVSLKLLYLLYMELPIFQWVNEWVPYYSIASRL